MGLRTLMGRELVHRERATTEWSPLPPPPRPHKGEKVPMSEKQKLVNREVCEAEKTSRHLTAFLTQMSIGIPKQVTKAGITYEEVDPWFLQLDD